MAPELRAIVEALAMHCRAEPGAGALL